jgi:hypothetical protein
MIEMCVHAQSLNHYREGQVVGEITIVGIDLAKNMLSVHAVGSENSYRAAGSFQPLH